MPQAALPTANERTMLRRRGLKPRDYYVIKRLNYVIILKAPGYRRGEIR